MTAKYERSWRRQSRGVTLVEALVGSAVLATLLVSILLAKGRLVIQSRLAQDRVRACAILDEWLERRWTDRNQMPRNASGDVPDHPGWRWRTRVVNSSDADAIRAQVVAVEIVAPGHHASSPAAAKVEILVSRGHEQDKAEKRPDAG